jgi:telomerase Cajal body protein 1
MSTLCPTKPLAKLLAQSTDVQNTDNFYQGCSFSPDGLCILTSTAADGKLRLYNTITHCNEDNVNNNDNKPVDVGDDAVAVTDWKTALVSVGGDTVRSYAWYPHMNSNDPASCCFVATRRYVKDKALASNSKLAF